MYIYTHIYTFLAVLKLSFREKTLTSVAGAYQHQCLADTLHCLMLEETSPTRKLSQSLTLSLA
jgi:hypothetical protein